MRTKREILIAKLFDNPLGRLYLGVPKGKKVYKITRSSAHYYTGELNKKGLPVITTGECLAGGSRLLNKFTFAGKFFGVISLFTITKFIGEHGLLPLVALVNTGDKFPGSARNTIGSWTNLTNLGAEDANFATLSIEDVQRSFGAYNYNFGVTAGATIDGFVVKVKGKIAGTGGNQQIKVRIYDTTDYKPIAGKTAATPPTTTNTEYTVGGVADLWDGSWTAANVNNNDYGTFEIQVLCSDDETAADTFSIDCVKCNVYYTEVSVVAPTVTTQAVTDKAQTTGTGNGNITDTGGENCTRRGFCYMAGASGDPTTANSVVYDDGSFGTGAYTKGITGLTAGTAYRVRAYAVNSAGTGYGATVAYTTQFTKTLSEVVKAVQPAPLKTTGKTFTAALAVVPVYADVLTVIKVFTQSVAVVGVTLNQAARILIESLKAVSSLANVLTAARTLTERIIIAPTLAYIRNFLRTYTEVITATGSAFFQASRTLIEVLKVAPMLARVLTAVRTLTETITAGVQNLYATSRTFIEAVIVVPVYDRVFTVLRTFTEIVKIVSTVLKNTGRTLSEVFTVNDPEVSIKSIFLKVLTEIVNTTSAMGNFVIGKLIVQPIRVVASLANVATFYKILTEVVKTVSQFVSQTSKIFIERFIITPIFATVATLLKVLTEGIVAASSKLYEVGRVFTERIIINGVLQTVLTVIKAFIETIKVAGTRLTETARTFIENILGVQVFEFLRQKNFTEIIKVAQGFISITARKFSETIVVGWQKLTHRSFSYIEHLSVRVIFMPFTIAKLLIERVVGSTVWEFGKTQFIELTDVVKVSVNFVRSMTRTFIERVKMASDVIIKYMGRSFEENIMVNTSSFQDELRLLYGRVLSEIVNVSGALGEWVIGKLLPEVIKIGDTIAKASAWLMAETIKVSGSLVRETGRIFVEIVNTISGKTVSIGRILTQVIKITDTTQFKRTQYKVLTDIIKATSALLKVTGRTFREVVDAIGTLGSWAIGKVFVQPVKIIASTLNEWQLGRLFSETIQVAGNAITQGVKIFTEVINVSGQFVLGTISKLLIEVVKITQFIGNTLPAVVFSETIKITSNLYNQGVKIFTETIQVVGTFVLGTISKLLTEIINIVEDYTKAWTLSRIFTETVKVGWNIITETGLILKETVVIVGTFVLGTISKLLLETVKVAGNIVFAITRVFVEIVNVSSNLVRAIGRTFLQVINVVNPNVVKLTGRIFTQTITVGTSLVRTISRTFTQVIHITGQIFQLGASFILYETIQVAGAMGNFVIGKLLKETISIVMKLKMVLNGIQVGLWKKIARITNGAWHKISRNDN